jgi:hypothetical protein
MTFGLLPKILRHPYFTSSRINLIFPIEKESPACRGWVRLFGVKNKVWL